MTDVCGDNRFEIIQRAKADIINSTNITNNPEEMAVLDNILYRCWQIGWLKPYDTKPDGIYMDLYAAIDGINIPLKTLSMKDASNILVSGLMDGVEKLIR